MYMMLLRWLVIPFSLVGWPLIYMWLGAGLGLRSGYWTLLYIFAGWTTCYLLWRKRK
jgi:hypothetical protein